MLFSTLRRKTAKKHNDYTSMLGCGGGVLWVINTISLSPNTAGRVDPREFDLCLSTVFPPTISVNHLGVHWQT